MLAAICRAKKARFIHVSTDYVFDGEKREPYTEEDVARPISVTARSKRGRGAPRSWSRRSRAGRARLLGLRARIGQVLSMPS